MLLILLALVIPFLVLYQIKRNKINEEFWKYILEIPGPKTYPLIGTKFEFHTPESLFLREREKVKEFFPIYRMWTIHSASVVLMTPEDVQLVLNNIKHINKGMIYNFLHAWLGTGLLTSGGKKWRMRRKILTPAFHFNILQEFNDMLNKETQHLVDNLKNLCNQPYIDVVKPITEFALNSVGETSFGVNLRNCSNCDQYKQALYNFSEILVHKAVRPWLWFPIISRFTSTHKEEIKIINNLHNFSTNLIDERRKTFSNSSQDGSQSKRNKLALLDLMLKAKESGVDIDYEGIREEVDTFVFEGHDTTAVSLCFTLMALANEQKIQDQLYQEIIKVVGKSAPPSFSNLEALRLMERCIKESLRLYPSVPGITRVAGENIKTKQGYTIPKGCDIIINIYDLHRNPKIWEDPEKFNPDRFLTENIAKRHHYAYIPFSAGSRNCIGQKFAIMELKAALCGILRNFKLEAIDKPVDIIYKSDLVLRPSGEVRVKFVPRTAIS